MGILCNAWTLNGSCTTISAVKLCRTTSQNLVIKGRDSVEQHCKFRECAQPPSTFLFSKHGPVRFHVCWLWYFMQRGGHEGRRSQWCDLTLAPDLHPIGVKLNSGMPRLTWQLLPGGEWARHCSLPIPSRSGFTGPVHCPAMLHSHSCISQ